MATEFKVITKTVKTNRGEYVLVEIICSELDSVKYGTIDKKNLKNGRATKAMNGFDMCMDDTIADALSRRIKHDEVADLIDAGMNSYEACIRVNCREDKSAEEIEEMVAKAKEFFK